MTRIKLRADNHAAYQGVPQSTVNEGELVVGVDATSSAVYMKLGTGAGQAYSYAVQVGRALIGSSGAPLNAYAPNGAPPNNALVVFDGEEWNAGAAPIEFSADSASGVLTYAASTDTWATDTSLFVPSSLDGGTFTGNFVAPSFAASYQPSIGDA